MPEITSAEEFACQLNAEENYRIVHGIGKEAREAGVYDPKYDTILIRSRDSAILQKCKEVRCRLCGNACPPDDMAECENILALNSAFREIQEGK